jgi:hypothetical protein
LSQMFETTYTAGGRLDAPHYPTFQVPYVIGMQAVAMPASTKVLEYVVPFEGELFSISIDCNIYQNDDNWTMKVDGEIICDKIFVKRAPEGVNLMAFIPVYPGTRITIEFSNIGAEKAVWCSLQFLKEGNLSQPPGSSGIKIAAPVMRLYIYDTSAEDGDVLNIFVNGAKIRQDFKIFNDAPGDGVNGVNYVEIPLQKGDNEIMFEGVSAGTAGALSGAFRVKDTSGNVLYETNELPSLEIARTNVTEPEGNYLDPKPQVSWIVNRTD